MKFKELLHGKKSRGRIWTNWFILLLALSYTGFIWMSISTSYVPWTESLNESNLGNSANATGWSVASSTTWDLKDLFITSMFSTEGVLGTLGVILGTTVFPNMYLTFAGITFFISGLFGYPLQVLGNFGLPAIYITGINILLKVLSFLALIGWYKGGDAP